jgi:xanthine dehydrogenase YagR molybdenum-binding subunit
MDKRRVMGQKLNRLDGAVKSSGRAKYSSDLNPAGLLHAAVLGCPHAHARVTSIDTSEAERIPGVTVRFASSTAPARN